MASTGERKPRLLRGTPANTFSKYLALGILAAGVTIITIYELTFKHMSKSMEKFEVKEFGEAREEANQNIRLFPFRSSKEFKKLMQEDKGSH